MRTARIIGTGSYLGKRIVTNRELAEKAPDKSEANPKGFDIEYWKKKLYEEGVNVDKLKREDLFDDWGKKLTGIEKRHVYDNDFNQPKRFKSSTEYMGAEAAKQALGSASIPATKLDYIIVATFTPDPTIPNAAATIGDLIGAKSYESLTINTACTGFVEGMIQGWRSILCGHYEYVLVVASETLTKKTNYNDAKTAVLFSDGAGAAVLKADNTGILSYFADTEYSKNHITLEEDPGYIVMEGGSEVLRKAVRAMERAGRKSLEKAKLSLEEISYVIPHQANQRITMGLRDKLKLPEERVIDTIKNFGNTSAASVGITLDKAIRGEVENYKIEKGDKLLLTSVGGGYTLASVLMEY